MRPTNLELIESFAQGTVKLPPPVGSVGNCASIALIKAAIEIFGLDNVFQHTKEGSNHTVTFKNWKTVTFTDAELERSNLVAGFELNINDPAKVEHYTRIYQYAQLALCAMVKRVMEIGEAGQGKGDFESALRALNDGANTPSLPEKLGLENYCLKKKWLRNANGKGLFGWFSGHTVYISQGVRDDYGSPSSDVYRFPKRMQIVERAVR